MFSAIRYTLYAVPVMNLPHIVLSVTEKVVETVVPNGVVGTLGLNWQLFLAQLINFSVVLFILWKWVFRPVVRALEARRERIEDSIKKAEMIERQMKESEALREQKVRSATAEAQEIIKKSQSLAEQTRTEAMVATKAEAEKMISRGQKTLEAKKQEILREIKGEMANLVVIAVEKILKEKLDEKKDRELINRVIAQIK